MGKAEKSNRKDGLRRSLHLTLFASFLLAPFAGASAQTTTSGLSLQKTCPGTASIGDTVTCTLSVENQGSNNVTNLSLTNQVPFPGGPTLPVAGCATALAGTDGTPGSGPDFTQCEVTEQLNQECTGLQIVVVDRATVIGTDSATGTVSNSATNAVLVSCTPGEDPPPPESVPAASLAGLVFLALGLAGFGATRVARRS